MIKAVFLGSDQFSLPVLRALHREGPSLRTPCEIAAVVTQPDRPVGRGRHVVPNQVKQYAIDVGIEVLQPERIRQEAAVAAVLSLNPDILIVASFGQILPAALLDVPPHKCLNLHPSLLPKYRGSSPVAAPILNGDPETGTTLMQVSQRMDSGPIVSQQKLTLCGDETTAELEEQLAAMGAHLLLQDLPDWIAGRLEPTNQDEDQATYTVKLSKSDGLINWSKPAVQLAREVRAYTPWPGSFSHVADRPVRLLQAEAIDGSASPGRVLGLEWGALLVGTGDGLLALRRLQLAGGRPVSAEELVRGHPGVLTATFAAAGTWS